MLTVKMMFNHHILNQDNYLNKIIIWFNIFLLTVTSAQSSCQFPSHWTGSWFLKGMPDRIKIAGSYISDKGNCTANYGDKFLIENRQEGCVRCMAIYEKHFNILQYKETYCASGPRRSLSDLCNEINGDAPLFSLFRLDTPPVPCPFLGYYKFTYNRGRGECKDPPSSVDSCTDENHLLFRFQACTDIQGSESKVVTLECYATWKGGSVRYLVGKFLHPSAKTEEDRFRCFVFDQGPNYTYHIAQSADATCDGLEQTSEGSAIMELTKTEKLENRCHFPEWAVKSRFWQTLNRSHIYDFGHNTSFNVYSKSDGTLLRFVNCTQLDTASDALVVHSTSGCDIGYVCMRIIKRSDNIIEILMGDQVKSISDACLNFNKYDEYITLTELRTDGREESHPCPLEGVYDVSIHGEKASLKSHTGFPLLTICSAQSTLTSQCFSPYHLLLESSCGVKEPTLKYFQCSGQWQENGTNFLLVYSADDDTQYCLSYMETDSRAIRMTLSSTTCRPNKKAHNLNSNSNSNNYNNNYDYQRNSHLFNFDSRRLPSEGIHFDLLNKGLCHATGNALSNYHISQTMLNLPIITMLTLLTHLLNNLFSLDGQY